MKRRPADVLDKLTRSTPAQVAEWLNSDVVAQHPEKEELREKGMTAKDRRAVRAGWHLTAGRLNRDADGLDLPALPDRIEKEMPKAMPEVQWTMNNTLAAIAIHDARLRQRAIGENNGLYRDWPMSRGCTPPYVPVGVDFIVKRHGCGVLRDAFNARTKITFRKSNMKATAFLLTMFASSVVWAQQKPTTGYAPVNGLKMYFEVHGSGDPVVLLHGSFMTITNNWTGWIGELSKTRKVIAIEMQGHGRTADIDRDFSYEHLADDVAALLDHLKIPSADLIGYSMGGGVAMQCAIRRPDKVRKVVVISARFRHDGFVKEGLDAITRLTPERFAGSPIETEYRKLSPTPDEFPNFVKHVIAMASVPFDFGADRLKATKAPMFFIHGDADGVRLEHIAEMFRLKGDEIYGDLRPRSASRLAILPNTTHVTLMQRMPVIVPMVNHFLDAEPQEK